MSNFVNKKMRKSQNIYAINGCTRKLKPPKFRVFLCCLWQVALKTLIVVHRTLREGDPTFREELLSYSHRGHILQISNFKDESSPLGTMLLFSFYEFNQYADEEAFYDTCFKIFHCEAWDCSAWVRTYALYLEERLECYRILKYDIESEHLTKTSPGAAKVCNVKMKTLSRMEIGNSFVIKKSLL